MVEYLCSDTTDLALQALGKIEIANNRLSVQRISSSAAVILMTPVSGTVPSSASATTTSTTTSTSSSLLSPPSRVLLLLHMVSPDLSDLQDPEAMEGLYEDIREECSKYGEILSIMIPKDSLTGVASTKSLGIGGVFVEYQDRMACQAARQALHNKPYCGRAVKACFFSEDAMSKKVRNFI